MANDVDSTRANPARTNATAIYLSWEASIDCAAGALDTPETARGGVRGAFNAAAEVPRGGLRAGGAAKGGIGAG